MNNFFIVHVGHHLQVLQIVLMLLDNLVHHIYFQLYTQSPGVHLHVRGFSCYLWNARYHVSSKIVAKLVGSINFIHKCGWLMKQSDTFKIWHRRFTTI